MATNAFVKTPMGKSYWNNEGAYQSQYDELYDKLVPSEGAAENLIGEVLRAASRLAYDYYNNGNMNACNIIEIEGEWIDDEDGGYQEDGELETEIDKFYANFIRLIREFGAVCGNSVEKDLNAIMDEIESIILSGSDCNFSDSEERPYVEMMDIIIHEVSQRFVDNNFGEIPSWYKN